MTLECFSATYTTYTQLQHKLEHTLSEEYGILSLSTNYLHIQ